MKILGKLYVIIMITIFFQMLDFKPKMRYFILAPHKIMLNIKNIMKIPEVQYKEPFINFVVKENNTPNYFIDKNKPWTNLNNWIRHKYSDNYAEFNDDMLCLAANIYHEARGSTLKDQISVGFVTINRVINNHRPSYICAVVWEHNQFSWTNDNITNKIYEQSAWELAKVIAYNVYYNKINDPTNGAEYYHTIKIKPRWGMYSRYSYNKSKIGAHYYMNVNFHNRR